MDMLQDDSSKSGMEWRLLLAVILSLVILFGFQLMVTPPVPVEPPQRAPEQPVAERERTTPAVPLQTPSTSGDDLRGEPAEVLMENDSVRLVWNTRRGGLSSIELVGFIGRDDQPLEIIPQNLGEEVVRPLEIRSNSAIHDAILRQAVFHIEGGTGGLYGPQRDLRMRFRRGDLEVVRTVRIPQQGYLLEVDTEVRINGRAVEYGLTLGAGIGREALDTGWMGDFTYPRIVYWSNNSVSPINAGDLKEGQEAVRTVSARWVAVDSLYFAYAVLSEAGISAVNVSEREEEVSTAEGAGERRSLLRGLVSLQPGAPVEFFVGPKYRDELAGIDRSLVDLIDYGRLALLVKPLVWALEHVNYYIGNYGFSIIILTFFINLCLMPIRIKQITSMKKMSEVQPQLKAIQDKFKKMKRDDPRRLKMNEEVMALYKEKGVNPLGGCLPLVVQMPFLFAFYNMLAYSIELRGAPFILWIQDLSRPDPYYITPVLMGATMVLQQKMTPMAGDPMQRRMMMLMPIMLTFFFLNVSSGLAVYFLFSNVFGMLFQQGYKSFISGEGKPKSTGKPKGGKKRRRN